MSKNKISWCDATWNPVVGCSKCSPGCKNCYAERMAKRLKGMGIPKYQDVVDKNGWTGNTAFAFAGFKHKKPALIFVCSMSDLFHESVPQEWHDTVFDFIESQPQHKFLILTKRPELLYDYSARWGAGAFPKNVWVGTSVSTAAGMRRLKYIYHIPAPVRFVSIEPMLEGATIPDEYLNDVSGWPINWVIVGGESGTGARPINPVWVRQIRAQCVDARVPFHFKQWGDGILNWKCNYGDYAYLNDGVALCKSGWNPEKKHGGNTLDGKEWLEFPK